MQKVAMISGASYGVGRAIAISLARSGWEILATARSDDGLLETASAVEACGVKCSTICADLATETGRQSLLASANSQSGELKCFVHCASYAPDPDAEASLFTTSDEVIANLAEVNFKASLMLLRDIGRLIRDSRGGGNIIVIASDWALQGSHGPPAFSAAKAALRHASHVARRDFAKNEVQLTVLTPGDVASFDEDWEEPKWSLDDPIDEVKSELGTSRIPLIDVAEAVNFILDRKLSRIDEIRISPLDPDYDY